MKTGRAAYKQQLLYSNKRVKKNIVKTNFVFVLYVFGINEKIKVKKNSINIFSRVQFFASIFILQR